MSSWLSVRIGDYLVRWNGMEKERDGIIEILGQESIRIVRLAGLTLSCGIASAPPSPSLFKKKAVETLINVTISGRTLRVQKKSFVQAVVAAESRCANSVEMEKAIMSLGVQKHAVQPLKPSQKELSDICFSLTKNGRIGAVAWVRFVLKNESEIIEKTLQWTRKTDLKNVDSGVRLNFFRGKDGKISIARDEYSTAPRGHLQIQGKGRSPSHLSPLQEAHSFTTLELSGVGEGDAQGQMTVVVGDRRFNLLGLTLFKKKDPLPELPQKYLEGVTNFSYGGESYCLFSKELVASLKEVVQGGDPQDRKILVKALRSVGIVQHTFTLLSIQEDEWGKALTKAGATDTQIDLLLFYLRTHHDDLQARLSWSSSVMIKERKSGLKGLPFTIRCQRFEGGEVIEVALSSLGEGSDKTNKSVLGATKDGIQIANRVRTRTREEGYLRHQREVERSDRFFSEEIEIGQRLAQGGVLFIREPIPFFRSTRRGVVPEAVLELCPRTLLSEILKIQAHSLDEQQHLFKAMVPYFCCVLRCLQQMHEMKICHLDIKTDNFLIAEDGSPRLIDLGRAQDFSATGKLLITSIKGTFGFIAPEIFIGPVIEKPDAVDIFSLGVILVQALSNDTPFQSIQNEYVSRRYTWNWVEKNEWIKRFQKEVQMERDVLLKHAELVNDNLAKIFDRIVYDCLSFDPEGRPTAGEILATLLQLPGIEAQYQDMVAREIERRKKGQL
jgi:serine/threonine protein kinase